MQQAATVATVQNKPVATYESLSSRMRAQFATYTDANQLLKEHPHPGIDTADGQGVLRTSEEMIYLVKRGDATQSDRDHFVAIIRSLQAAPGLINRNPPTGYHEGQESFDDYVGMVAAAHVLGGSAQVIADEVAAYGDNNSWFMNNVREGTTLDNEGKFNAKALFVRQQQYIAHFHYCAGRPTSPTSEAVWAAVIANGAQKGGDADQIMLQWLMIQCAPSDSGLVWAAIVSWSRNFRTNYPGGLRDVQRQPYERVGEPNHPLVEFAPAMDVKVPSKLELIVKPLEEFLLGTGKALVKSTVEDVRFAKDLVAAVIKLDPKKGLEAALMLSLSPQRKMVAFGKTAIAKAAVIVTAIREFFSGNPPNVPAANQAADACKGGAPTDNYEGCKDFCDVQANALDDCTDYCSTDHDCVAMCAGRCKVNDCRSACEGAENLRRTSAALSLVQKCKNKKPTNKADCDKWCDDTIEPSIAACAKTCPDAACRDSCSGACGSKIACLESCAGEENVRAHCHQNADAGKAAKDGWCDNCSAHCAYGSEEQCTQGCKDRCEEEKDGNRHPGHSDSSISHYCSGEGWNQCLAKCGGIKGCRNSWCDENHPERDKCHADADREQQAALSQCDNPQ